MRKRTKSVERIASSTRTSGNGEDRPMLSVKTNEKGQIFSHVRQKWLAETPYRRFRADPAACAPEARS